jgi:hypothetical protein
MELCLLYTCAGGFWLVVQYTHTTASYGVSLAKAPNTHEAQASLLRLRNPNCREWRSIQSSHRGAAPPGYQFTTISRQKHETLFDWMPVTKSIV